MNELYLNKCYFKKEYWWRFSNVLSSIGDGEISQESLYLATKAQFLTQCSDSFYDWLTALYPELCETIEENTYIKQPIYDIFMLIQKRFSEHYVFSTEENNAQKALAEMWKWLPKLFNVIEYTYKKYSKIIELYNSNYNDLMKQLESTTESGSRFNDTPQSAEVDLSFEENQFTTNLTKAKQVTHTDSNTPIVKIEEIWQNYRKVILEWLNEFESLFVEENNV